MFLAWYYVEAPLWIMRGWMAYAKAFAKIVPFGFLIRTLFSPWKNIVDRTVMHGIDLQKIAEKLSLGLLARLVGCTVRLLTIAIGLVIECLLLAGFAIYLAIWLTFPLLLLLGLSFCIRSL